MKVLLINAYIDKSKIKELNDFLSEMVDEVIVSSEIPDTEFSGAVISGSEHLISKEEHLPHISQWLKSTHIPVIGICFGHQLVAHTFGGVIKDSGEVLKKTIPLEIIKEDPIFHNLPGYIEMAESHREYVDYKSIQENFELLATSKYTEVEAIKHKKRPIYGLQFHPERSGKPGKIVIENFLEIIKKTLDNRKNSVIL